MSTRLADDLTDDLTPAAAVAASPEVERLPIEMAYFSDRTYRQVAVDLGATEGTVRSRIRSGLRHLSLAVQGEAAVN